MRFCLVTDQMSPHEMPLAHILAERLGEGSFQYIVTTESDAARRELGWTTENPKWCRIIGRDESVRLDVWQMIERADVVLFGNRNHPLLPRRLALGRFSILGSERWFKPPLGRLRLLHPGYVRMVKCCRRWLSHPAFVYLAQGVHAVRDMRQIGMGCSPTIRLFGYLVAPSVPVPAPRHRTGPLQIVWVGRMLDWKRVDTLIRAVGRLAHEGRAVRLTLVGHGSEESRLRALAAKAVGRGQGDDSRLTTHDSPLITFLPPVPISEVRGLMRQADVYVLPSSGTEGWGVVVNEAMLEGCAVIASRESGAGATLIRDGKNGLLFPSGDVGALTRALERLDSDETFRYGLAATGQADMLAEWTPSVAAERLVTFCSARLMNREPPQWASGPLSVV